MKQIIFQMTESGQLNKLLKKWSVPEPNCIPLHKEGKSLGLEKMISLFLISLIGICIGFFILIIEKICYANQPMRNVSIKESNKMQLQRLFLKLQKTLNNDEIFIKSTMSTLIEDMQHHNALLNDTFNFTEVVHDEQNGRLNKNWRSKIPKRVR